MSSSNWTGCSDTAWCMTLWRFVEGWHYIWGSCSGVWCNYSLLGCDVVIAIIKMHMSWVRHSEHRYSNPQLQQVVKSWNMCGCSVNVKVTEQNIIVGYVNMAVKTQHELWQSLYFQI
jgi:hypothetical protein